MKKKAARIAITAIVIGGALTYLISSSFGETMVYYKTVEETLAERSRFEKSPVRVNGLLEEGSIQQKPGTDEFRFTLSKNGKQLLVTYAGILPDTMKPGTELVVEGILVPGRNELNASEILTKCPSKYEEEAQKKGGR